MFHEQMVAWFQFDQLLPEAYPGLFIYFILLLLTNSQ